jgi:broad specificity phosphatase PhoE
MKTLVLVRHAATAMAGRFCGQSNPDLDAAGIAQLPHIVQRVAPLGIGRILSSDLRRASQTAQAIAERTGVHVELHRALREIHFGLWEGLNWTEIEAQFPREAQAWLEQFPLRHAPQGERHADFSQRVEQEFGLLFAEGINQTTAIVTHRGVMQYALIRFFGRTEQQASEQTAAYGAVISVESSVAQEVLP